MKAKDIVRYGISVVLILVTVICVLTPSALFFKQFTQYTLYIMLGLLALGILFFVMNTERLMTMSLVCCGVLCIYLKSSSNDKIRLPIATASPSLRISHVSLGNAEGDYDIVIDYLLSIDADMLSFQELTPDWNAHLINRLAPKFKYIQTFARLDQYGMGFFSKIPFQSLDTIYFRDIPNLTCQINLRDHEPCNIISCQVTPPVNQAAFDMIMDHFNFITAYIKGLKGSTLVLGDFHLPPWAAEVQKFKANSLLQDGRRDIHTRNLDGSMSLPRIPVEHILYSDPLDCTSFAEIGNSAVGRLGITGTYQLQHEEVAQ